MHKLSACPAVLARFWTNYYLESTQDAYPFFGVLGILHGLAWFLPLGRQIQAGQAGRGHAPDAFDTRLSPFKSHCSWKPKTPRSFFWGGGRDGEVFWMLGNRMPSDLENSIPGNLAIGCLGGEPGHRSVRSYPKTRRKTYAIGLEGAGVCRNSMSSVMSSWPSAEKHL